MKTCKVQTQLLSGKVLDWAVAKAQFSVHRDEMLGGVIKHGWYVGTFRGQPNNWIPLELYNPSSDHYEGGIIIDREKIAVTPLTVIYGWRAHMVGDGSVDAVVCCGPTRLIAAMRCYAISQLGSEIDVPADLLEHQSDYTREQAILWCIEMGCDFIAPVLPPPPGWRWVGDVRRSITLHPEYMVDGCDPITMVDVQNYIGNV